MECGHRQVDSPAVLLGSELASTAFGPNGQRLAAVSWNGTVMVVDVNPDKTVGVLADKQEWGSERGL